MRSYAKASKNKSISPHFRENSSKTRRKFREIPVRIHRKRIEALMKTHRKRAHLVEKKAKPPTKK